MKKWILITLVFLLGLMYLPRFLPVWLTTSLPSERYRLAEVVSVSPPKEIERNGFQTNIQEVEVKLMGSQTTLPIEHEVGLSEIKGKEMASGKQIILLKTGDEYSVFDIGRIDFIIFLSLLFIGVVFIVSVRKGLRSVLGIVLSLLVILLYIAPSILQGQNPVLVAVVGTTGILIVTMFLSHGINKKSISAFLATLSALFLAGILSYVSIRFASLSGLTVDQATYLNVAGYEIQLQGLLLAGIIISLLGILDDVTVTQSSIVETLYKANPKIKKRDLFVKSFHVGRDHIASIVNTLVLVYAGVSLPLFLILYINPSNQPLWVLLNGEVITTEIVRTLCGSIGIILAVPIAGIISSWMYTSKKFTKFGRGERN